MPLLSVYIIVTNTLLLTSPVASMTEERAKAAFDIRALTVLMDGGEKATLVSKLS